MPRTPRTPAPRPGSVSPCSTRAGRQEAQAAFEEALSLNEENWVAMLQLAILMQDADPDRAVEPSGPR